MKINRNKGNLQSQLAKMLQAGMENVESETNAENQSISKQVLHANEQSDNNINNISSPTQSEPTAENNINNQEPQPTAEQAPQEAEQQKAQPAAQQAVKPAARASRSTSRQSSRTTRSRRSRQQEPEAPRLNAAQRHEVPDHNAKYAGEPIKSVGCRMPQSLYARMLQYKAMNDSQLNRITLNDIIIEAVEKFMDANQ